MVRRALAAAAPLLALALAPCGALAQGEVPLPPPAEAVPPEAFALVEGQAVLKSEVAAEAQRFGLPPATALQRLVTRALMRFNLRREGIDPKDTTPEQIAEAVAETERLLVSQGRTLDDWLREAKLTREQLDAELRLPVTFQRYVRAELGDDVLRARYERRKLALAGELRARHILVRVDAKRDATAARARAMELLGKLGAAPEDAAFAGLASEASDDPLASLTGGDLDWISARGRSEAPPEVVAAAFLRGEPGLVAEPVRGREGFHLVFVREVRLPESATFERLRPRLLMEAEAERAARILEGWAQRTRVAFAADAPRGPQGGPGAAPTPGRQPPGR